MTWLVVDGLRYSMVDEGGPGGDSTRAGKDEDGDGVISTASLPADVTASYGVANTVSPPKVAAVRRLLHDWGVTTVVLPDQDGLPSYAQIPSVTTAAVLVTAATGRLPAYQDGAWVWTAVNRSHPAIVTTAAKFSECTSAGTRGTAAVDTALACITSKGLFMRMVTSVDGLDLIRSHVLVTMVADTTAVRKVEFVITGKGTSRALSLPAHPFVYGWLAGWVADPGSKDLPDGTYTLRSVASDAVGDTGSSPGVTVRFESSRRP
jgi:hypothetical protein